MISRCLAFKSNLLLSFYDFVEKVALVKSQAFQVTLDEIGKKTPKASQAKPEQFYDNSLVQELIDEGFFKNLWW